MLHLYTLQDTLPSTVRSLLFHGSSLCVSRNGAISDRVPATMDSPEGVAAEGVRRRLKRKQPGNRPSEEHVRSLGDVSPEVVPGACRPPQDAAAGAMRPPPEEHAIVLWSPQESDNAERVDNEELDLCRQVLWGNHDAAGWRRGYKRLWMRLQRLKDLLTQKPDRTPLENEFLDLPGALVRAERIESWLRVLGTDEAVVHQILHGAPESPLLPEGRGAARPRDGAVWIRERVVLLTYNGSWGTGLAAIIGDERDPERAANRLRGHPVIHKLSEDFRTRVLQMRMAVQNLLHWAFSVEICPETLASGKGARVHIHLCLSSGMTGIRKLIVEAAQDLTFGDSVPMKSATGGSKISRGNINVAMFYVLVSKIGQVHAEGTCRLHKDLLVNPEWAFNLLQQGKVTTSTVRKVIIACAKNVPRLLANLQGYELAVREGLEDQQMQTTRATVNGAFRPFRHVPAVAQWLASFDSVACRYKFLVLEGPSQLGKTQFAVSLALPDRTLIVDCSGATEPDLRRYRSEKIDAILFDEAKASMVIRSKKLFQSGMDRVYLGQSNTNCHAYTVAVHAKRMIIASNTWSAELQQLPSVDVDWLRANSVHILVDRPLWADEPDGHADWGSSPLRRRAVSPTASVRDEVVRRLVLSP